MLSTRVRAFNEYVRLFVFEKNWLISYQSYPSCPKVPQYKKMLAMNFSHYQRVLETLKLIWYSLWMSLLVNTFWSISHPSCLKVPQCKENACHEFSSLFLFYEYLKAWNWLNTDCECLLVNFFVWDKICSIS